MVGETGVRTLGRFAKFSLGQLRANNRRSAAELAHFKVIHPLLRFLHA